MERTLPRRRWAGNGDVAVRVRYKHNREPQFYESMCLTTVPREQPPILTGPFARCADCPYPGHGFLCWGADEERCLRTEVARIMERDRQKSVGYAG